MRLAPVVVRNSRVDLAFVRGVHLAATEAGEWPHLMVDNLVCFRTRDVRRTVPTRGGRAVSIVAHDAVHGRSVSIRLQTLATDAKRPSIASGYLRPRSCIRSKNSCARLTHSSGVAPFVQISRYSRGVSPLG